jgi:hypothetical protein
MEISMDGLTGCDNHVWKGRESRMKNKKYGWPRRCLSLICVMVLISMIVLQSVPVTYVSGSDDSEWLNMEPDPFTSEPEGNSQMTETSKMEPEQENNPFSDGTTSDGVTEVSEEPQLTETPEVPPTEVPEVSPTETPEISPTEIPEPSPTEKPDNADAEVTKYDYQSEDINVKVTLTDPSDLPDNAKLVVTPVEISQEAQDQLENTQK